MFLSYWASTEYLKYHYWGRFFCKVYLQNLEEISYNAPHNYIFNNFYKNSHNNKYLHVQIFFKKYNFLFKKNKNIFYKPNCLFQELYHYKTFDNNFIKFSTQQQLFNLKKKCNILTQTDISEPFRLGNLVDLNRRSFSM